MGNRLDWWHPLQLTRLVRVLTFFAVQAAQWTHIDDIGCRATHPKLSLCIVVGHTAGHITSTARCYETYASIIGAAQHQNLLQPIRRLLLMVWPRLCSIAATARGQASRVSMPGATLHALGIAEAECAVPATKHK